MIRQRRELFDEYRVGLPVVREVPCRFVDDGSAALFATQLGNVPALRVHLVTLAIWQTKPCLEQFIRLRLFHRGEIQSVEDVSGVEIASQQTVVHLPEEVSCGVMPSHQCQPAPVVFERSTRA